MIHAGYDRLNRYFGRNFTVSPELPRTLLIHLLFQRALWLARGWLLLRKPVFVGRGVSFRGKSRIRLGRHVTLEPGCRIDGFGRNGVRIGERSKLGSFSTISCTSHPSKFGEGFEMGSDCGISEFCYFGSAGGIRIGNSVIMGQYVSFHSEEHQFGEPSLEIRMQPTRSQGIQIGNDVWIGAKATLLDGTEIGDRCVIAAGAVVRGRFPSGSVIAGVPARVTRTIQESEF